MSCINWEGAYSKGICYKGRKNICREIYEKVNGNIPEGYKVFKSCKNSKCINISHLYISKKDMYTEPQYPDRNGINNTHHVLTNREVRDIRNSKLSNRYLSSKYGVSRVQIWRIKTKQQWRKI